jgi:hypothetical protein
MAQGKSTTRKKTKKAVFSSTVPLLPEARFVSWAVPPVTGYLGGPNTPDLPGVLLVIINTFLLLASVLALAFIIIGGFRYITSSGNQEDVEQAKKTVTYAVVGLLVIILAAVIVNFVIFAGAGAGG